MREALLPEYRFDYSKARSNLRTVLVQRRSKAKRVARPRPKNELQRTKPVRAKKPRR